MPHHAHLAALDEEELVGRRSLHARHSAAVRLMRSQRKNTCKQKLCQKRQTRTAPARTVPASGACLMQHDPVCRELAQREHTRHLPQLLLRPPAGHLKPAQHLHLHAPGAVAMPSASAHSTTGHAASGLRRWETTEHTITAYFVGLPESDVIPMYWHGPQLSTHLGHQLFLVHLGQQRLRSRCRVGDSQAPALLTAPWPATRSSQLLARCQTMHYTGNTLWPLSSALPVRCRTLYWCKSSVSSSHSVKVATVAVRLQLPAVAGFESTGIRRGWEQHITSNEIRVECAGRLACPCPAWTVPSPQT